MALELIKVAENQEPSKGALTVRDLRKAFTSPAGEKIEVLRGIQLTIAPGEVIAVTGASGSGKSTLLHLLGGLEEADHGTIALNEFDISSARASDLTRFRRGNIGFVFQFHHLLPDLTVIENVTMPLLISRTPAREARTRANEMLKHVGLGSKCDYPVSHLSGGEQQRTAVARALIGDPRLILADEPTGNLDITAGDEVASLFLNHARTRRAMVVVATHNPGIARSCDRILSIHDGRIT